MYIHLHSDRTEGIYLSVETDKNNNNPLPILDWAKTHNFQLQRIMGQLWIDKPEQINSFLTMLDLNIQEGHISPIHLAYRDPDSFYHINNMILIDSKVKLSTLTTQLKKAPITVENFQNIKSLVNDAYQLHLENCRAENTKTQELLPEDNRENRCLIL
jgi:hypothetical protein